MSSKQPEDIKLNKIVNFRATQRLKKAIDDRADKEDRKTSDWIRLLVERELKSKKKS